MAYYSVTKQSFYNYQRMLSGDFCILCSFPLFSVQCHLTAGLSRSDPVDSVYSCVHGCVLCLELWSQEIYDKIDFNQNHISHMIHAEQHTVQQYIKPYSHTLQ
jgi:hypothetical protein